MKNIDSIILAAGQSTRMGTDKALLNLKNEKVISLIIRKLSTFSDNLIIVLGENYQNVKTYVKTDIKTNIPVKFIFNDKHHLGMFSSLKKGIRHLKEEKPLLIQLVDQPFLSLKTYDKIIENLLINKYHFFKPYLKINKKKRGGHPIIATPKGIKLIRQANLKSNLREVMKNSRIKYIKVDNEAILQNINTPKKFKKYKRIYYGNENI